MLNSNGSPREDQMYTVKSALLTREEKNFIRRAIFLYQKDLYQKYGDLPDDYPDMISEIADKLQLR